MKDLTIIDGHNYLFRAFYGVPEAAKTKQGVQVNAVYGFFAFLRQIVAAYPKNKLFVVFDSETGIQDKLEEKEEYKDNRVVNTDMFKQLPFIKSILDIMNIKWLEHPGYEADDIIASIAVSWTKQTGNVYISSNDFDFVQLVSDKIHLIRSVQGKLINCDANFVKQKFNVKPIQYVEYLSIVGDKTDNIAGVGGIGPKTASYLLNQHYTIDNIFKNISSVSSGIQKKLMAGQDIINKNKKFITMKKDIPEHGLLSEDLPETMPDLIQQKIAIYLNKIGVR